MKEDKEGRIFFIERGKAVLSKDISKDMIEVILHTETDKCNICDPRCSTIASGILGIGIGLALGLFL